MRETAHLPDPERKDEVQFSPSSYVISSLLSKPWLRGEEEKILALGKSEFT